MLVNLTFADVEKAVARRAMNGPTEKTPAEQEEWNNFVRETWSRHMPTPLQDGVYNSHDIRTYVDDDCSHEIVSEFPNSDLLYKQQDVSERMAMLRALFEEGRWRSDYGSADNLEQVLEYYKEQVEDPKRMYVITCFLLTREKDGGYRFHKNGPYIGDLEKDEDGDASLPEHLADCEEIQQILQFHLLEVKAREEEISSKPTWEEVSVLLSESYADFLKENDESILYLEGEDLARREKELGDDFMRRRKEVAEKAGWTLEEIEEAEVQDALSFYSKI